MARRDQRGRRIRRNFRPDGDGLLESRELLAATVTHVAYGGQIAVIRASNLGRFNVVVTNGGVVRAQPMIGGAVKLIVSGTNASSILTINPVQYVPEKLGLAHHFGTHQAIAGTILNVGEIDIKSGQINQILGFKTADLSGSINIAGTTAVDRIAFNELLPGASITTGGDLNTLDVNSNVNLAGGPGISVGRDLNWIDIGGDLNLSGGSSIVVGRDIGLTPQSAKGTDTGGQGGYVQGNVSITAPSTLTITRSLQATFLVNGNFAGAANVSVAFGASNFFVRGAVS